MERNPLQEGLSNGWQTAGKMWTINQRAASDLLTLTETGIRTWMELNQTYVRRVVERPEPVRLIQLNAEYLQALFGVARKDAEKRAEVVSRASRELASALTGSSGRDAAAAVPAVNDASPAPISEATTVAELAAGPEASPREVQEAVQEAMDDDLQQIDGVGKVMAKSLREGGINTIAELAVLDVAALEDEQHPLHALAGRIVAEEWVEQARALSGLPQS